MGKKAKTEGTSSKGDYWDSAPNNKITTADNSIDPLSPRLPCMLPVPAQSTSSRAAKPATLKILLWNIENLGGGFGRPAKRSNADIAAIAALLKEEDADVSVILEVRQTAGPVKSRRPSVVEDFFNHHFRLRYEKSAVSEGDKEGLEKIFAEGVEKVCGPLIRGGVKKTLEEYLSEKDGTYKPEFKNTIVDWTNDIYPNEGINSRGLDPDKFARDVQKFYEPLGNRCVNILKILAPKTNKFRMKGIVSAIFKHSDASGTIDETRVSEELDKIGLDEGFKKRVLNAVSALQQVYASNIFLGNEHDEDAESEDSTTQPKPAADHGPGATAAAASSTAAAAQSLASSAVAWPSAPAVGVALVKASSSVTVASAASVSGSLIAGSTPRKDAPLLPAAVAAASSSSLAFPAAASMASSSSSATARQLAQLMNAYSRLSKPSSAKVVEPAREKVVEPGRQELERIVAEMGPEFNYWPNDEDIKKAKYAGADVYSGNETVGFIYKVARVKPLGHQIVPLNGGGRLPHLIRMQLINEGLTFRIVGWHAPSDSGRNFAIRTDHFSAFQEWCSDRKGEYSPLFLAADLNIATEEHYPKVFLSQANDAGPTMAGATACASSSAATGAHTSASYSRPEKSAPHEGQSKKRPRDNEGDEDADDAASLSLTGMTADHEMVEAPSSANGRSSFSSTAAASSPTFLTSGKTSDPEGNRIISNTDMLSLDEFMRAINDHGVGFENSVFTHYATSLVKSTIQIKDQAPILVGPHLGKVKIDPKDYFISAERNFAPHQLIAEYMDIPAMFGHRLHAFDKITLIRGDMVSGKTEKVIDRSTLGDFADHVGLYEGIDESTLSSKILNKKREGLEDETLRNILVAGVDPMRRLSDHLPIAVTYSLSLS